MGIHKKSTKLISETNQALPHRGLEGDTEIWLIDKSQRDMKLWGCPNKCWVIDNKMYDLSKFMENHPGGRHWIEYTQGHEISELFKVHHLDEAKARKILQKYYIGDCPIQHASRFDFEESGLFQTLRKRILKKYSIKQLQDSSKTKINCALIFGIWFLLLTLTGITQSMLMAIACGTFMVYFYGIGHAFIHKPNNIWKNAFILIGFTPKQQIIMHCISHHVYSNTLLDYQYAGFQPICYFGRCLPQNKFYTHFLTQILYMFVSFANIILKLLVVPIIHKRLPDPMYLITLVEWLYLAVLSRDIVKGFVLFGILQLAYGFAFGKAVICQHRQPKLWSVGADEIKDYVLHQISTTYETGNTETGLQSLLLHLGFNNHALHHVLPTIDVNMLGHCQKIFEQLLQERAIKQFKNEQLFQCNKNLNRIYTHREQFNMKNVIGQ